MLRTALVTTAVAAALVTGGIGPVAQPRLRPRFDAQPPTMSCSDRSYDGDRARHCEIREDTIGGANPLDVDAGHNGGIRVRGWDRGDVLVRTRIEASPTPTPTRGGSSPASASTPAAAASAPRVPTPGTATRAGASASRSTSRAPRCSR